AAAVMEPVRCTARKLRSRSREGFTSEILWQYCLYPIGLLWVRHVSMALMTRALIALTSHDTLGATGRGTGFYASEAAEPWAVFTAAGYDVDLVSVAGGRPAVDGRDLADETQQAFFAAADLDHTRRPADLALEDYDVVYFAGGHGTMWDFPGCDDLA